MEVAQVTDPDEGLEVPDLDDDWGLDEEWDDDDGE
jgi:hypothetical protein